MKEKHRIEFPGLSDAGNAYARQLSLAFSLPEGLREVFLAFGIVLPDIGGDEAWKLPIPARIVIDGGGVIRGVQADPDHARCPEPESTIEVLRAL